MDTSETLRERRIYVVLRDTIDGAPIAFGSQRDSEHLRIADAKSRVSEIEAEGDDAHIITESRVITVSRTSL